MHNNGRQLFDYEFFSNSSGIKFILYIDTACRAGINAVRRAPRLRNAVSSATDDVDDASSY